MKISNKILTGLILLVVSIGVISCSNTPKGDDASVGEAEKVDSATGKELAVDLENSKIGFTGNGVGKNHPGYFKLSSGNLMVTDGKITGGNFIIDTKSLVLDQKDEMFQTKLLGHLLSADFLDAEKYPTSKFEITSVEPFTSTDKDSSVIEGANVRVSGNFTLKDATKNVSFPAKIDITDNGFSAIANFNIDRTLWGLKYGNDKSLKDKFISEVVNITFDIKSK